MQLNFKITNLHCASCVKLSESVLSNLPGVTKVEVGQDGVSTIESDREIKMEEIKNALAEVGKEVA